MDRRRRFWSPGHFSKGVKSYWGSNETLNEVDKGMKVILLSFYDDLIPCMQVEKASVVERQKQVFGMKF